MVLGLNNNLAQKGSHVEVSALAGTGKTTTMIQGLVVLKGGTPSITPSPQQEAVWEEILKSSPSDSVRVSAFNKTISEEAGRKMDLEGLGWDKGCRAQGIHGLGYGVLLKRFPQLKPDNNAMYNIIEEILGVNYKDSKEEYGSLFSATDDLVSLCKQTLTEPTPDNLDAIARTYDIEIPEETGQICELVPEVLRRSLNPKNGLISFDDMIYIPLKLGLKPYRVNLQIVDESQDLNRMQQELMYQAGERIIYVGDRRQAIYAFAGADSGSMDRMSETLAGTPRGHKVLELTVTRRCSKAVVTEAQKLVEGFTAHESNLEGEVLKASYPVQKDSWDKTYLPLVKKGDMILCRVNAPLVSQCFKFISRDIKAIILGRKIGQGLINLIKKARTDDCSQLRLWLQEWYEKEVDIENKRKFPSEMKLIALKDKLDCLLVFAKNETSVEKVIEMTPNYQQLTYRRNSQAVY